MNKILPGLAVAAFLAVHLGLGFAFIRSAAPTYDEPVHLASGYSYLSTGRYRLNIMDHPPFAEMWGAIPLLFSRPSLFLNHPDFVSGRLYHYSDFFLYHNNQSADSMLTASRVFLMLTLVLLVGGALAAWAFQLSGIPAMIGAAAAFAFCPALLSNLPLATTDGVSAALFFATFWLLSAEKPLSTRRWIAAGVCAGLAYASKFNMILLVPLAAVLIIAETKIKPKPLMPGLPLFLAAAFVALVLAYRVGQFPLYIDGLLATLRRLDQGRGSFFFGRHSVTGSWLYFPAALFVKTPLPLWILAAAGLAARRAEPQKLLWAAAPPVIYFGAALTSKVQIGYRHVLPVIPFIVLWAGCGCARLWNRRWGRAALAGLYLWLVAGVLRVYPHYLAYFNETVGGPQYGYKYLTDSNLDWGQDLKNLAAEINSMGNPPVYLSYFGSADPAAYGLHYLPVAFMSNAERPGNDADPSASGKVLFAVSATNLQCTYFQDSTLFDWLKAKAPAKVIGYSIFLYDLTGDGDSIRHLANLLALSGRPRAAQALAVKARI